MVAGIYALRDRASQSESSTSSSGFELIAIGTITGIGSALTGTGGPLLLIPILIWRKVPVLTAIGLSQAIQVPISLMATLGNFIHADVDLRLGIGLALVLAVGALLGAKTVHLLPIGLIRKMVAILLVAVGLMILLRMIV